MWRAEFCAELMKLRREDAVVPLQVPGCNPRAINVEIVVE